MEISSSLEQVFVSIIFIDARAFVTIQHKRNKGPNHFSPWQGWGGGIWCRHIFFYFNCQVLMKRFYSSLFELYATGPALDVFWEKKYFFMEISAHHHPEN